MVVRKYGINKMPNPQNVRRGGMMPGPGPPGPPDDGKKSAPDKPGPKRKKKAPKRREKTDRRVGTSSSMRRTAPARRNVLQRVLGEVRDQISARNPGRGRELGRTNLAHQNGAQLEALASEWFRINNQTNADLNRAIRVTEQEMSRGSPSAPFSKRFGSRAPSSPKSKKSKPSPKPVPSKPAPSKPLPSKPVPSKPAPERKDRDDDEKKGAPSSAPRGARGMTKTELATNMLRDRTGISRHSDESVSNYLDRVLRITGWTKREIRAFDEDVEIAFARRKKTGSPVGRPGPPKKKVRLGESSFFDDAKDEKDDDEKGKGAPPRRPRREGERRRPPPRRPPRRRDAAVPGPGPPGVAVALPPAGVVAPVVAPPGGPPVPPPVVFPAIPPPIDTRALLQDISNQLNEMQQEQVKLREEHEHEHKKGSLAKLLNLSPNQTRLYDDLGVTLSSLNGKTGSVRIKWRPDKDEFIKLVESFRKLLKRMSAKQVINHFLKMEDLEFKVLQEIAKSAVNKDYNSPMKRIVCYSTFYNSVII